MSITGLPRHKPDKLTFVGCHLSRTTNQTLTTGTVTAVSYDNEIKDPQNMHDNGTNPTRVTIPTGSDGRYEIIAISQYAINLTGEGRARIHINGSVKNQNNKMAVTVAGEVTNVIAVYEIDLVAGDYIEHAGYHTKGSNHDLVSGVANTQLLVRMVSRA